jgi:hypothetical protein
VQPGNGGKLVLQALHSRKWWSSTGMDNALFNLLWEQVSPPKRFQYLKAPPICTQMLNHIEGHRALTHKRVRHRAKTATHSHPCKLCVG